MNETIEILKRIESEFIAVRSRLGAIEHLLAKPILADVLIKSHYSCSEVADLTQLYGTKKAKPFTVRLASKDGRIPEASKVDDGSWHIPKAAVERILSEGIPPERRSPL
jgi:hypothetical protein